MSPPLTSTSNRKQKSVLFLGDCNTLGTPDIEGKAYPEQFANEFRALAINCGHTMTTVREGSEYLASRFTKNTDAVCLQYGLVDSWKTFKFSPYILYYPDSRRRKFARKLVKKFKKWCKSLGLNALIGEDNVVPVSEYRNRILSFIEHCAPKPLVLIETVPNKDISRNAEIRRYNAALKELAAQHEHVWLLPIYDDFCETMSEHYSDPTHLSETGHAHVAKKLSKLFNETIFTDQKQL